MGVFDLQCQHYEVDKRKGASDIMFMRLSDTEKVSNIGQKLVGFPFKK